MNIFQPEIPKRTQTCAHNQESFTPGMAYCSVLLEGETDKIIRRDYCMACWEEITRLGLLTGIKTHWKSKVPQKRAKEKNLSWQEKALEHLMKLLQASQDKEALVFALLLARKRVLLFRKQIQESNAICDLYEVAGTEEILPIRIVTLTQAERDEIQNKIIKELAHLKQ